MRTDLPAVMDKLLRAAAVKAADPDDWLEIMVRATSVCPRQTQARLTLGLPAQGADGERQLGNHLYWWPAGLPSEELVGVVSSRLSRALEDWSAWFLGLRALCAGMHPSQQRLLVVADTTTGRFAGRAADLFGLSTLIVEVAESGSLESWWKSVATVSTGSEIERRLFVSPPLAVPTDATPVRDATTMALADQLTALFVRPGGNVERLVRARLAAGEQRSSSLRLLIGQGLTSAKVRDSLLEHGCVGWHVAESDTELVSVDGGDDLTAVRVAPAEMTQSDPWQWLTHCTRRCDGPWPQQREADYLDQLILDPTAAGRSALATLKHIVTDSRVVASARGVRGSTSVVCFTAVPLAELGRLRIFRPHRGRWDFQPYGICIRRGWLASRGARPVRYATAAAWDQMPDHERPYFQKVQSLTKTGNTIDWTVEEEWRLVGDVPLDDIPRESAFLFVPTDDDARQLAGVSRWPVYVLQLSP